jgi:predicted alpha/beta superfamily hydrolase
MKQNLLWYLRILLGWVVISFLFQGLYGISPEDKELVTIGKIIKLTSKVLKEERPIYIYLPGNYEKSTQKYPVVYLLDGKFHFHSVTGVIKNLDYGRPIPGMIVVGIANTNRNRDLSPPAMKGEAENFIKFIKTELIPFIETNFRTHPYRILIGHSRAGLFTLHTLLNHHQLFNAYIVISPSIPYVETLIDDFEFFFKHQAYLNRYIYITVGFEHPKMMSTILEFANLLKYNAPYGLEWKYKFMENGNHYTSVLTSISDGLIYLFSDIKIPRSFPVGGIDEIREKKNKLIKKYGYDILDKKIPKKSIAQPLAKLKDKEIITVSLLYNKLKETDGESLYFDEVELDNLGHYWLAKNRIRGAIEIFKLNASAYPSSWNAYNSLATAYECSGNKEKAQHYYKKAHEINSQCNNFNKSSMPGKLKILKRLKKANNYSQTIDLGRGLMAYYPFNGNTNDASGNKNHGKVHGAILTVGKNDKPGSAYSFDGKDDYIEVNNNRSINICDSLTICFLVKPKSYKKWMPFISKANNNNKGAQWDIGFGEYPSKHWVFTLWSLAWKNYFVADNIPIDTWSHIAVVADQSLGKVTLYKNGKLIGHQEGLAPFTGSEYPLRIGRGRHIYFHGSLDEIRYV